MGQPVFSGRDPDYLSQAVGGRHAIQQRVGVIGRPISGRAKIKHRNRHGGRREWLRDILEVDEVDRAR
jgi:hypothetical protein